MRSKFQFVIYRTRQVGLASFLACLLVAGAETSAAGAQVNLYGTGFESLSLGSIDGQEQGEWHVEAGSTASVQNVTTLNGAQALQVDASDPYPSVTRAVDHDRHADGALVSVDMWLRRTPSTTMAGAILLAEDPEGGLAWPGSLYSLGDQWCFGIPTECVTQDPGIAETYFHADTWYHARLVLNFGTETFDVFVNDQWLASSSFFFWGASPGEFLHETDALSSVGFFAFGDALYVDDLSVDATRETAQFQVTNANDSGPGSLREAIALAAQLTTATEATITLDPGLLIQPLSKIEYDGYAGLKLECNQSVLDGSNLAQARRILEFHPFSFHAGLSVSGCTFQNLTKDPPLSGAALMTQTTPVEIRNSTFRNNEGAIDAEPGGPATALSVDSSTFSENTDFYPILYNHWDSDQGGIALDLVNSSFNGNHGALQVHSLSTPGRFHDESVVNIRHSSFTNNVDAYQEGVFLWANDGLLDVHLSNALFGEHGGIPICVYAPATTVENTIAPDASCGATTVASIALGPLADNGGLTETMLPTADLVGSIPAPECSAASDQRGEPRGPGPCTPGSVEPQPETCTLTATEDSWVRNNRPTSNYGSNSSMWVRPSNKSGNNVRRAFVSFAGSHCLETGLPLGSAPTPVLVLGATLDLYNTVAPSPARTLEVARVLDDWSEGLITWSNQPSVAAAPVSSASTTTANTWMQWALPSDEVQDMIDTPSTDRGWRLADANEDDGVNGSQHRTAFRTSEAGSSRPTMTILYGR